VDLESLKSETEETETTVEAADDMAEVEEGLPVQKRALVIGAGIAGIQAALDLAGRTHGPARQDLPHHGLLDLNPGPQGPGCRSASAHRRRHER